MNPAYNGLLVEAESFQNPGGWTIDTEFIHIMGSPYLLAHGLGKPVSPATTTLSLPRSGRWFVWVRTKNWVPGPWESPGRFRLAVNGAELPHVFGAGSGEWEWESGGAVNLSGTEVTLALIDLSGFDARCDAVFLTQDELVVPDSSSEPMSAWRRQAGMVEDQPSKEFGLVIVGGGIAGVCAALAAARAGLRVALIHERPVLGGNASTEVQVGPSGGFPAGRFPRLGDIVREVVPDVAGPKDSTRWYAECEKKRREVLDMEPNVELMLEHHVYSVEIEGDRISGVWAMPTRGGERCLVCAPYFVDATGHGLLGLWAGADYHMEARDRMGMTNWWRWHFSEKPSAFPDTPWALESDESCFPYPSRPRGDGTVRLTGGFNFPESGFSQHPLNDLEAIRDHNLRAIFGAWSAIKNHGVYSDEDASGQSHARAELEFVAGIGGPRETLQLLGDVVVSDDDVYAKREWPDACVPATWGIDLHFPMPLYARANPDNPFISRAHFDGRVDDSTGRWADSPKACLRGEMRGKHDPKKGYLFPYRSFYSRNIENLFMAGRNVSVTHEALGTIRVMNTLGMVGVVVGRAAAVASARATTNRGVYEKYLAELNDMLAEPGCYRHSGQ